MTEYFTQENIEFFFSLLGAVAVVAFPSYLPKIKLAEKLSKEVAEFVKKDEKPNKEVFKQAIDRGCNTLAKEINKRVDPHVDFYNG